MDVSDAICLVEYQRTALASAALSGPDGTLLRNTYGQQVEVEPPSIFNDHRWCLTAQGWVGQIPLAPDLHLRLQPKTSLRNLFGMFEYAYRIRSFRVLQGLTTAETLQEFYTQLASVLARRVLDRARKGLYRTYRAEEEPLSYVRGRIELARAVSKPWDLRLHCLYEDHTADVDENRILAWTLWHILHTGYCTEPVLTTVREAFRTIRPATELQPYAASACVGRFYHRLNEDYQPLHALSRFFLANTGPAHQAGDHSTIPFLVNMAELFELFVAEWLRVHLAEPWTLRAQEVVSLDSAGQFHFKPDLVIYHRHTGEVRCVLDTKYKVPDKPATEDIAQALAYAHLKQAREAILIYPSAPRTPLDAVTNGVRVRSAVFDLSQEIETAGQDFLASLALTSKK